MKRNHVTLAVLLAALSVFAAPSASAIPHSEVQAIKTAVANVPAAELAAKAAQLVSQASKIDRKEVALVTVREIVSKRPAAAVAAVAAIAKAAPDLSVVVAAEAAKLSKDQAAEIATAAAFGAPSRADQIAAAVSKVAPNSATEVTRSVGAAIPDRIASIKEAVVASVPSAKAEIANDTTITRLSQRSASTPTSGGVITTRPGTISGQPEPTTPPLILGAPIPASDIRRIYGTP